MGQKEWWKGPWLAFGILCSLVVTFGWYEAYQRTAGNKCSMTYMRPAYREVALNASSPYRLYQYFEGGYAQSQQDFALLFVPGHGGSFEQVRSLGKVVSDRGMPANVYTVDFLSEPAALHSGYLWRESQYLDRVLHYLSDQYGHASIVLVCHSFGGVVARATLSFPRTPLFSIRSMITLATPHQSSPVMTDRSIQHFYTKLNGYWQRQVKPPMNATVQPAMNATPNSTQEAVNSTANVSRSVPPRFRHNFLSNLTVLSVSGGLKDTTVSEPLTYLAGVVRNEQSYWTSAVRLVGLSMDHRAIVWCNELVVKLVDLIAKDLSSPVSHLHELARKSEEASLFEDSSVLDWAKAVSVKASKSQLVRMINVWMLVAFLTMAYPFSRTALGIATPQDRHLSFGQTLNPSVHLHFDHLFRNKLAVFSGLTAVLGSFVFPLDSARERLADVCVFVIHYGFTLVMMQVLFSVLTTLSALVCAISPPRASKPAKLSRVCLWWGMLLLVAVCLTHIRSIVPLTLRTDWSFANEVVLFHTSLGLTVTAIYLSTVWDGIQGAAHSQVLSVFLLPLLALCMGGLVFHTSVLSIVPDLLHPGALPQLHLTPYLSADWLMRDILMDLFVHLIIVMSLLWLKTRPANCILGMGLVKPVRKDPAVVKPGEKTETRVVHKHWFSGDTFVEVQETGEVAYPDGSSQAIMEECDWFESEQIAPGVTLGDGFKVVREPRPDEFYEMWRRPFSQTTADEQAEQSPTRITLVVCLYGAAVYVLSTVFSNQYCCMEAAAAAVAALALTSTPPKQVGSQF